MKILIRTLGLTIIGIFISITLMHLIDKTIRVDELNKLAYIATTNTQIVMMENIEDIVYGTDNKRLTITSNEEYLDIFKDNFEIGVTSDTTYEINDLACDYATGLLNVEIIGKYKNIFNEDKTITKKVLNIVDVKTDYEEVS